jgi:uncharacterized protein with NAD-binding domain and iron-sulfur cluster
VKGTAAAYWRAARDAEDAIVRHRQSKFAIDIPLPIKMNIFEHMVECLKYLKEKESVYRDNANSFLHTEFKTTMEALTEELIPKIAETDKKAAKDQDRKSMLAIE